jgi:hypothetical protein
MTNPSHAGAPVRPSQAQSLRRGATRIAVRIPRTRFRPSSTAAEYHKVFALYSPYKLKGRASVYGFSDFGSYELTPASLPEPQWRPDVTPTVNLIQKNVPPCPLTFFERIGGLLLTAKCAWGWPTCCGDNKLVIPGLGHSEKATDQELELEPPFPSRNFDKLPAKCTKSAGIMITVVLLFSAPTSATICIRRNSSAAGFPTIN